MKAIWPYLFLVLVSMVGGAAIYYWAFVPETRSPVHAPDVIIPPVHLPDTSGDAVLEWASSRIRELQNTPPETLLVREECRGVVDSLSSQLLLAFGALEEALQEARAETVVVLGDPGGPSVIFQHRMRFHPMTRQFEPEFLGILFSSSDSPAGPPFRSLSGPFGELSGVWKPELGLVVGTAIGLRIWMGEHLAFTGRAGLEGKSSRVSGQVEYHLGW